MGLVVTEQSIAEMAPNDRALLDARGLLERSALKKLAKNDDGTLVFGQCQGSGGSPYSVSMDLGTGGDRPVVRCSCPSRQFPCKHGLALMLAFARKGALFPVEAPPQALQDLRAKQAQRIEKMTEKKAGPAAEAGPRAGNKTARTKKAKEQREALETLESFLVDLVTGGLGGLTGKSVTALDHQTRRLFDADMKGAAAVLARLSALVSSLDGDEDATKNATRNATRGLSEEHETRIAWMLTHLYTTARRGQKALTGKLVEEGASQSEADAQLESILGKRWLLPELKEAGYWMKERRLLELAHERTDDPVTEFATATGYMLDLDDGSIVREVTTLPFRVLRFEKLRSSRQGTLEIQEAALYPGDIVNRRARWDDKTEGVVRERPRAPGDYDALHRHARPLEPALKALRAQLKNPQNPLDAVFLIQAARFGTLGDELVLEDPSGARLVLKDPRGTRLPGTGALRHAAAAFGPGSLAVSLYFDLAARAIYGDPLALFVGEEHLRLRAG